MLRTLRPRTVAAWLAAAAAMVPLPAASAETLCVGRGTGQIAADGTVTEDAMAGGTTPEILCNTVDDVCFDVSSPQGGARTRGGAGPSVGATPGFLHVETTTTGQVYEIPGEATIVTAGSVATVDRRGRQAGAFGGARVTLEDGSTVDIAGGPAPCGRLPAVSEFPGFRVTAGRTTCLAGPQNLLEIVVEGLVVERPPGVETVLDRSAAGVEIPFAVGVSGCSLASAARGEGLRDLLPTFFLLVWLARRRAAGAPGGSTGSSGWRDRRRNP